MLGKAVQVCGRDLDSHTVEGNRMRLTQTKEVTLITYKELRSSSPVPGEESGSRFLGMVLVPRCPRSSVRSPEC